MSYNKRRGGGKGGNQAQRGGRGGGKGKGKSPQQEDVMMSYQPGLIPKKPSFEVEETVSEKALEQKARARYLKDRSPEMENFQLGTIHCPFLILANGFPSDEDKATSSAYIVLFDEESIKSIDRSEASVDLVWGSHRTWLNSVFKKEIVDKDGVVRPVIRAKITKKEEGVFPDEKQTIRASNGSMNEDIMPTLASLVPGRLGVGQARGVAWRRGEEYGVTFYINKILVGPMDEEIVDRSQPGGGADGAGEPQWQ